jgi:hypothetical protein
VNPPVVKCIRIARGVLHEAVGKAALERQDDDGGDTHKKISYWIRATFTRSA